MPDFTLYGRANCSHCEQLRFALDLMKNGNKAPNFPLYAYIDVDSDPLLQEEYGLRVPVLIYGSKVICAGVFDIENLEKDLLTAFAETN